MQRPEVHPVKEFLKEPRTAVVCSQCNNECGTMVYFCRTTANHGFAHVVDNSEIFCWRWLWAAVIAAFACVTTMLIHSSVTNLVSQSLTTEFVERSHGEPAILPDIHICDNSIFNMTRLAAMGLNNTMATYLTLATSANSGNPRFLSNPKKREALKTEFDKILAKGPWTLKSVIENAAIKCDEMVLGCTLAGDNYDPQDCCNKFFDPEPYVSIFGSCITTHGKTIPQLYQSRDAGFVVYILPNNLHFINSTPLCEPHYLLDFDYSLVSKFPRQCQIECVKETYDLSLSYANFNTELIPQQYRNVSRYDPVVLHFFYPSFQYQARISHTNTYLKWLGEVGGNLGLFLGASLISILEVLALFFRCCIKFFST